MKKVSTDDCWLFAGEITRIDYGRITERINGVKRNYGAHRVMYENLVGMIPDGLQADHLCRVRRCINPEHIDVVTAKENVHRSMSVAGIASRRTTCAKGHEYTPENTRYASGSRVCRMCATLRYQAQRQATMA